MGLLNTTTGFIAGFTTGFGAGLFARDYLPKLQKSGRPLLKTSIRSIITLSEQAKEIIAKWGETLEDTLAEIKVELKDQKSNKKTRTQKSTHSKTREAQEDRPHLRSVL